MISPRKQPVNGERLVLKDFDSSPAMEILTNRLGAYIGRKGRIGSDSGFSQGSRAYSSSKVDEAGESSILRLLGKSFRNSVSWWNVGVAEMWIWNHFPVVTSGDLRSCLNRKLCVTYRFHSSPVSESASYRYTCKPISQASLRGLCGSC